MLLIQLEGSYPCTNIGSIALPDTMVADDPTLFAENKSETQSMAWDSQAALIKILYPSSKKPH